MDSNLIQWPRAKYWTAQWNPIIGCKPCSPACEHCYAAAWAKRFGQSFEPHLSSQDRPPRKGVVFCGNMTDLFGGWLEVKQSAAFIEKLFHKNRYSGLLEPNDAVYLFLTKRVARMEQALREYAYVDIPHALFGFTAEDQTHYDERLYWMEEVANRRRWWISCEPLLGSIDLRFREFRDKGIRLPEWVVVGCESGARRRPCPLEWVESIVEQCMAAKVPVFVKQLDINGRCVTDINRFPAHLRIRQVPWAKENQP